MKPAWNRAARIEIDAAAPIEFGISEISLSTRPKSVVYARRPAPSEGRFAIVTDVGRGMRWTRQRQKTNDVARGRRSRVVLTPRRWRQVGGGNSADDGGKQARSPGRARRNPLKPLRGECRAFSGVTVVTNARVYYTTRAAAGASGARHSLRPLNERAGSKWQSSGVSGREIAKVCLRTRRRV